jgi:hypothetical protein
MKGRTTMLVKDANGKWYEVADKTLAGKEVDAEQAREAVAAERAAKRQRVADLITGLDEEERQILRRLVAGAPGRVGPRAEDCDCWECDPMDCDIPWDCDPMDCYDCADCDGECVVASRGPWMAPYGRLRRQVRGPMVRGGPMRSRGMRRREIG